MLLSHSFLYFSWVNLCRTIKFKKMTQIHLYISREDSVRDVQDKFSCQFPFLRITFFKNKIGDKKITGQSVVFCSELKMTEITKDFHEGDFEMDDNMTVLQLENKFYQQFGLFVQVCRKSGNLWMEPNMTSGWSVKEQNEHGKDISPNHENPILYRDVPYGC